MPINSYKPQPVTAQDDLHESTTAAEYDLNFAFAAPDKLESNGVVLVPLIPSVHAEPLLEAVLPHAAAVFRWLPYSYTTLQQLLIILETCRRDPGTLLFAVFDKSLTFGEDDVDEQAPARLAGVVGYLKCSEATRSGELGHLTILPRFQRSHVTTHACVLLMRYLFDDLGLRRAQWFAHARNEPSIRAGERLGFKREGLLRWERVLQTGKEGETLPEWAVESEKQAGRGDGRHSCVLGLAWDDWFAKGGVKERTDALMARPVEKRQASFLPRP